MEGATSEKHTADDDHPLEGSVKADPDEQEQQDTKPKVRTSSRDRTQTEKGIQATLETYQRNVRNLMSSWRKEAYKLDTLITDSGATQEIRMKRDNLATIFQSFDGAYKKLEEYSAKVGE